MNHYEDTERGTFQTEHYKQPVSFKGMLFKGGDGKMNVTPTDIDGYIQLDEGNVFIYFELKRYGGMPYGQEHAYTKNVDVLTKGGGNAILFEADHDKNHLDPIEAIDAIITRCYYKGEWHKAREGWTVYDAANRFIEAMQKRQAK